jgi:hypothetical protein
LNLNWNSLDEGFNNNRYNRDDDGRDDDDQNRDDDGGRDDDDDQSRDDDDDHDHDDDGHMAHILRSYQNHRTFFSLFRLTNKYNNILSINVFLK